jgi:hypothetical protein
MADRTDIDALLISALYGELTPADEARLAAHLESHPADRTALADLGQTRASIRERRLAVMQFEPPQSVSARLLQEAARSAPKTSERGSAGWLSRLTRTLFAHPAMATAAMFGAVVVIAGALFVRHGDQLVEPSATIAAEHARIGSPQPAAAPMAPPPSAADTSSTAPAASEDKAAAGAGVAPAPAAEPKKLAAPVVSAAPASKPSSPSRRGIEVRTPDLTVKDLDDDATSNYQEVRRGASVKKSKAPASQAVFASKLRTFGAAAQPPDAETASDLAWAQQQHDRVIGFVNASQCSAAASAAVEIYNRVPAYYLANVANDRAVKPCLPYLTSEREREDRKRASEAETGSAAPVDAK